MVEYLTPERFGVSHIRSQHNRQPKRKNVFRASALFTKVPTRCLGATKLNAMASLRFNACAVKQKSRSVAHLQPAQPFEVVSWESRMT
jgi:hypothetical protein